MRAVWVLVLALPSLMAGCSAPVEKPSDPPLLIGWKNLELGMSFDDAIAALPNTQWNPSAAKDCLDNIALNGCFLSSNESDVSLPLEEGMRFVPQLSFNNRGALTDIDMVYQKEGKIAPEQCQELHERTLDRITRESGQFRFPDDAEEKAEKGWRDEVRTTKQHNRYAIGYGRNHGFVTSPMRNQLHGVSFPNRRPIPEWNDRPYVSILSSLIMVDGIPWCHISVIYSAPASVARRKM